MKIKKSEFLKIINEEIHKTISENKKDKKDKYTGPVPEKEFDVSYQGSIGNIRSVTVTYVGKDGPKITKKKSIAKGQKKEDVRDELKKAIEAEISAEQSDEFRLNKAASLQREDQNQSSKIIQEYILKNNPQPVVDVNASIIEIIANEVNETLNNLPEIKLASQVLSEDELKELFSPLAKQIVTNVHGQIEQNIKNLVEMEVDDNIVAALLRGDPIPDEDRDRLEQAVIAKAATGELSA